MTDWQHVMYDEKEQVLVSGAPVTGAWSLPLVLLLAFEFNEDFPAEHDGSTGEQDHSTGEQNCSTGEQEVMSPRGQQWLVGLEDPICSVVRRCLRCP